MKIEGVYLLHFEPAYKHARHYIGYSGNINTRIERHIKQKQQPLIRAALKNNCQIILARIWEGKDRKFERKLHNLHGAVPLCPICKKGLHNS